jgi:hypothetical protein
MTRTRVHTRAGKDGTLRSDARIAKRSDWKTEPLPERNATIPLDRAFTRDEMERIRRGLVPEQMEDKWFVFWEDDTLHLHRSWTGACISVVRFATLEDGGARMVEARVNRDPEQYKETSDAKDSSTILSLVKVLLLRDPPEPPADGGDPTDAALRNWSLMGRASLGEHPSAGRGRSRGRPGAPAGEDAEPASRAPATRDYFAELYVAALFGDAGWSVYFPKRDVGFDFIATKEVRGEVLLRPVQVKGLYSTAGKTDKAVYGFRGELTAVHESMVLALPYFHTENPHAPEHCAFNPLDQCKSPTSGSVRCEPAKFAAGHAVPRRECAKYFDRSGLELVESAAWGRGA